jgi:diguanylate cyclase (GGDEF)-like protein
MVYEYSLGWRLPLIEGERLLNQLTAKIRDRRELTEVLTTSTALIQNFVDADRVQIVKFSTNDRALFVAESSKEQLLPPSSGQQWGITPILAERREYSLQQRYPIAIDVNTGKILPNSSIRSTAVRWLRRQVHLGHQPLAERYLAQLQRWGVVTCLVAPISHQGKLWGLLLCHHYQAKRFHPKQLQILQLAIDQLSIAIAQSQLVARAQVQSEQDAIVQRIGSMLHTPAPSSTLEVDLLAEITRALGADGGRMFMLSEPLAQRPEIYNYGLHPRSNCGLEKHILWQKVMYAQDTLTQADLGDLLPSQSGDLERLGRELPRHVYQITDLDREPLLAPLLSVFQGTGIRSLLLLPLRYNHQCVGCITLFKTASPQHLALTESDSCWHEDWLKLAHSLAMHLYLAMMQKRVDYMLSHQAYYDSLTDLPNRLLLQQSLTLALAKSAEAQETLAVIFLDLDRFKNINDSLGHGIGDRLLQLVAQRLKEALDPQITLGRWGGDEFTLIIPEVCDISSVQQIADRVLNCLRKPLIFDRNLPKLNTNSLYIKGSMGIAIAPYDGTDSETLLKHADAALYRAKQKGKNNYEFYTTVISHRAIDRLRLENLLYQAIDRELLVLHYQPQIDIKTQKVIGVEALLRCQDLDQKLISPGDFMPIAEETGSISQMGEWVLREACRQNKIWQNLGLGYFPIAVNLSVQQLKQENLVDLVTEILTETQLAPDYLELEITESLAIEDLDLTIGILQRLRKIGVKISLDDFGTGYSSLAALKYLPLDCLKIDRSFIRDLCAHSIDAGIVKTIINLGHELHLNVVAEGVETDEQLQLLSAIGCDAVQGFFFSRPIPAHSLAATIGRGGYWIQSSSLEMQIS